VFHSIKELDVVYHPLAVKDSMSGERRHLSKSMPRMDIVGQSLQVEALSPIPESDEEVVSQEQERTKSDEELEVDRDYDPLLRELKEELERTTVLESSLARRQLAEDKSNNHQSTSQSYNARIA